MAKQPQKHLQKAFPRRPSWRWMLSFALEQRLDLGIQQLTQIKNERLFGEVVPGQIAVCLSQERVIECPLLASTAGRLTEIKVTSRNRLEVSEWKHSARPER